MTDYITDREIERLALGELNETEANEMMRRLEELDELDRLEAIIADDEAFLDAHPPALLAAQVRDEVHRRTRQHTTEEPRMINPSRTRFAIGIAAGFAAAAVLFAIVYVQFVEAPTRAPDKVASMTNSAQTNNAAPSPTPTPPPPAPEPEPEPKKQGQLLIDQGTEFVMPPTYYMSVGDTIEASASGISRISMTVTSVIDANIDQDAQMLHLEAKEAGQSLLSLTQKIDGRDHNRSALVVVGESLPDEVVSRMVRGDYVDPNYPEGPPSLAECAAYGDEVVTLRIVAQVAMTFVGHAHAEGKELSPELKACIDGVAARWQPGYLVPGAPTPEADARPYNWPEKLSVGKVRYNFGTSAICETDDDDC